MSLDFITDLLNSKGFNAILIVVDQYTKMTHFLSYTKDITSEDTANIIMHEVFRHHGFPDIMDLNLYLNFGSTSSQCSRSLAISPPTTIPK